MYRVGVILIIACFLVLSYAAAQRESLTYDEIFYLEEGASILKNGEVRDPYNPPLHKILTGIPSAFGMSGTHAIGNRMVITFLSLVLIYGIYKTARRWYGDTAGFTALVLAAFEPTILGHSHYVTGDTVLALFLFSFAIAFLRFTKTLMTAWMILSGLFLGMAMATKVTGLVYGLAIMGCILALWTFRQWKQILFIFGVALLFVWGNYGFTMKPILVLSDNPGRVSSRLMVWSRLHNIPAISSILTFSSSRSIPLGGYIEIIKNTLIRGAVASPVVFLGKFYPDHRWYFLAGTLLLKIPIVLLALFFMSLLAYRRQSSRARRYTRLVLVITAVLFVFMSGSRLMPQVRYALSIYPFLILGAVSGIQLVRSIRSKAFLSLLLAAYVIETLMAFPHFIAYGNVLAGPRDSRYRVFTDSNIDWGQSLPDLNEYVKRKTPSSLSFSYFGRDDAALYGFPSSLRWGGYTFSDICAFHPVTFSAFDPPLTAISVSNWYGCGYNTLERFGASRVKDVVGDSILIF